MKPIHALAAGIATGLGGYAYLACQSRYLGAFMFGFGLWTVCEFGLPLFTGRCAYLGSKDAHSAGELLLMLVFNMLGAAVVGLMYQPLKDGQDVVLLASIKIGQGFLSTLIRAVLCGVIVFISVEAFQRSKEPLGRYVGVLSGVALFIICGLDQCIADTFYMAAAFSQDQIIRWDAFPFLLAAIAGNTLGGMGMRALMPPRRQAAV